MKLVYHRIWYNTAPMNEIYSAEKIIDIFGLKYNPRFSCVSNAVVNGIRIQLNQEALTPFPEMYVYQQLPHGPHAYPVWNNIALNGGVTADKGAYPNFSAEFLRSMAENRTEFWLKYTLEAFSGGRDFAENRKHIEMVFTGDGLIKAVECLEVGYKNLNLF